MTPLRQRMLEDMQMRNFSPHTQAAYSRAVAHFARHFGRSPDQLDREHIRAYLLTLVERRVAWSTYNQVRCALHFFYRVTLHKDWPKEEIVCAKTPKKLPVVFSRTEVAQFLEAAHSGAWLNYYGNRSSSALPEIAGRRSSPFSGLFLSF